MLAYFISRLFSLFGDDLWNSSMPAFLAYNKFNIFYLSFFNFIFFISEIIGLILFGKLISRFKLYDLVTNLDLINSLIFLFFSFFILIFNINNPIYFIIFVFISNIFYFSWSSSNETSLSFYNIENPEKNIHKINYISILIVQILSQSFVVLMTNSLNLFLICLFNSFSFFIQFLSSKKIFSNNVIKKNYHFNIKSIKFIFEDKMIFIFFLIPAFIKNTIIPLLSILSYYFIKNQENNFKVIFILIVFTFGGIFGGFYRINSKINSLYLLRFKFNIIILIFLSLLIVISLVFHFNFLIIFVLLFLSGFVSTVFTLQLKLIREKLISIEKLPIFINYQMIFVRLLTPVSSFFIPILIEFDKKFLIIGYYILVLFVVLFLLFKFQTNQNERILNDSKI